MSMHSHRPVRRSGRVPHGHPTPAIERLEARILLSGAGPSIELISLTDVHAPANSVSSDPSVSADGRYVAFASEANNLLADDADAYADIYVYDRLLGQLECVSLPAIPEAPAEGKFDYDCTDPVISADGRYVAFLSSSAVLTADDGIGSTDLFVHDRTTGQTERLTNPLAGAPGGSVHGIPQQGGGLGISADGRYIVMGYQTMPGGGGVMIWSTIQRYDRIGAGLEPVTVGIGGVDPDYFSFSPDISADGRYVVYQSLAANLVASDTNGMADVFRTDMDTGTTVLVSVAADGSGADFGGGPNPSISAEGRYVAFESSSTNLVAAAANYGDDIYVRDMQAGSTRRVSVSGAGVPADHECSQPAISADGRHVAYVSVAGNLVSGDVNTTADIFRYDLQDGQVVRVSQPAGADSDGESMGPSITADGQTVVFASRATNLVPGDINGQQDAFAWTADSGQSDPPDLIPAIDAWGTGLYHPADTYTATVSLDNGGGGAALGGFDVDLVLSIDRTLGNADDVALGRFSVGADLPAGQSTSISPGGLINPLAAMGRYYLAVIADTGADIAESNETNNVTWTASADIIVVPVGYQMPVVQSVSGNRQLDPLLWDGPMRYVAGPGLPTVNTTFTAQVSGSPASVSFTVGGVTVVDNDPSGGWTAQFNMSQLASPGPLVVVADGVTDPFSHDVDILMLPDWFQDDEVDYAAAFDPDRGYVFSMDLFDLAYGFDTPDSWVFSDPVFGLTLIDLSNKWSGVRAGSRFELVSSLDGEVSTGPLSYGIEIVILDYTLYDKYYELSRGTVFANGDDTTESGDAGGEGEGGEGGFTGHITGDVVYLYSDDLEWEGAGGRVTLALEYKRDFTFFTMRFPLYSGGMPGLLDAVIGGGLGIEMGLEASVTMTLGEDLMVEVHEANVSPKAVITPKVFVGIEALFGALGKVHCSLAGHLEQRINFEWDGDLGFDISAPGALGLEASLNGSILVWNWNKSWYWRLADWDFFADDGADMEYKEQDNTVSPEQISGVAIAGDGHGNALAAYISDDPANPAGNRSDLVVQFRRDVGDYWAPAEHLTASNVMEADPAVAYAADGVPHVVWTQGNTPQVDLETTPYDQVAAGQQIMTARYDQAAETWTTTALTADARMNAEPDVAFAPTGSAGVAVWHTGDPSDQWVAPDTLEISLARWAGGAWAVPQQLTDNDDIDWAPAAAYLGDGRDVVAWLFDDDGDRVDTTGGQPTSGIRTAVWDGSDWTRSVLVPDGVISCESIQLVPMPDGSVDAYWVAVHPSGMASLQRASCDGATWGATETILSNWFWIDSPSVTVDDDGRVAVVYQGFWHDGFGVYRIDRASPWSQPTKLTEGDWVAGTVATVVEPNGNVLVLASGDSRPTSSYQAPNPGALGGLATLGLPPKLARNDTASGTEDLPVEVPDVLANDTGAAGLTLVGHTQPAHGTLTDHGDGSFTYDGALDFRGTDTFTYTVADSLGNQDTATVTLAVAPINDRPSAQPTAAETGIATGVAIPLVGSDIETDPDDLEYKLAVPPDHGTVTIDGSTATYVPNAGYAGSDTFRFTVTDQGDANAYGASQPLVSAPAEVTVEMVSRHTAPTGIDLLGAFDTGASSSDDVTRLDNSEAGKAMRFEVSGTVVGTTITVYADGTAIGSADATYPTTTVTTDGLHALAEGVYVITARHTSSGATESADSAALGVTVDYTAATLTWDGTDSAEWTSAHWNPGPVTPGGVEAMVVDSGTVTVSSDLTVVPGTPDLLDIARNVPGGTVSIGVTGAMLVTGDVNVAVGGTLNIDGVLAAGAVNVTGGSLTNSRGSAAAVTVVGDVALGGGGTFAADAVGAGVDTLITDGAVALGSEASLEIAISGGGSEFVAGTYTLIEASGGLSGTFANVTDLGAYVSAGPNGDGLTYDYIADTVTLTLDRDLNPADGNLDGQTDVSDRIIWNNNNFTFNTTWAAGDYNGDGRTDVSDRIIWNNNNFTFATAAPLPQNAPAAPAAGDLGVAMAAGSLTVLGADTPPAGPNEADDEGVPAAAAAAGVGSQSADQGELVAGPLRPGSQRQAGLSSIQARWAGADDATAWGQAELELALEIKLGSLPVE